MKNTAKVTCFMKVEKSFNANALDQWFQKWAESPPWGAILMGKETKKQKGAMGERSNTKGDKILNH